LAGFFVSVQSVCTECAESCRGWQRTATGDARRAVSSPRPWCFAHRGARVGELTKNYERRVE